MSDSSKKIKNTMKLSSVPNPRSQTIKSIKRVFPLGYRVLVKISKEQSQSDGGLYLPDGAKESMQESLLVEVLEVASAQDDELGHETNVSGIPLGATVLIPKEAGIKVPWDDTLRIVETQDVLAVVSEIAVD